MTEIRFSRAATNGLELHLAEAGPANGPLVVLLHGFPEFWRAWRAYLGPLARAGFHVVAPDQRGYGLSDKTAGVAAYDLDRLAGDVAGFADYFGQQRFSLVGHDWGASVGWWLATKSPERLRRLVLMNAPHPAVWREAMRNHPGFAGLAIRASNRSAISSMAPGALNTPAAGGIRSVFCISEETPRWI